MCPCTPPVLQCTTRADARGFRGLEDVPRAFDVDRAIRRVRLPGFAIRRRNVIDDLDALDRATDRGGIQQVAVDRRSRPSPAAAIDRNARGSRGRTSARTVVTASGQIAARDVRL